MALVRLSCAALLALGIAACDRSPPSRADEATAEHDAEPKPIAGTTWALHDMNGRAAPDGRSPAATLTFEPDGTITGTIACNLVGPTSRWTEGGFAELGGIPKPPTVMGCLPPDNSAAGAAFWREMASARTWARDGKRLTIVFADETAAHLYLIS